MVDKILKEREKLPGYNFNTNREGKNDKIAKRRYSETPDRSTKNDITTAD